MFILQACDITGGLYLKIPQKLALAQYLLVRVQHRFPHFWEYCLSHVSVERAALCWCWCFLFSGCSCPTLSSVHSWCCHRLHMWTTEPRVSATATSLRLVMCAQFVCQVSLIQTKLIQMHDNIYNTVFTVTLSLVFPLSILQLQPHLYNLRVSLFVF